MKIHPKFRRYAASRGGAVALAVVGLAVCILGWNGSGFWLGGAVLLAGGARAGWLHFAARRRRAEPPLVKFEPAPAAAKSAENEEPGAQLDSLVAKMISDGRYALLLRPQIAGELTPEGFQRAYHLLEDEMALVPTGDVGLALSETNEHLPSTLHGDDECREAVIHVNSLYIDRYPITNEQFQAFVDGGGYEQSSLWHPDILPAVLDFVDKTCNPGPRYWQDGRYPPGQAKHPVVGVSWYEACAYARWVGKRLPTDAEWVKAGSWPVTLGNNTRRQRRYPWGQSMDRERANLWLSAIGGTVPVHEFAEGVSVGGVYQLIGNVWEWTSGDFDSGFDAVETDAEDSVFKNIRGGAFDTYFDNQASCQFASGEHPLLRKHNIGFRCCLGLCDLAPDPSAQYWRQDLSDETSSELEEVHA